MQIEVRVTAAHNAPSMGCGGRVNDLGRLVRERVASMAVDWPALGFERIEPDPARLRVVVNAGIDAPTAVIARVLTRAIRRETRDLMIWRDSE